MRTSGLQNAHPRPRKVCYGCKQEVHFIRDCPNSDRYRRRFQYFCDVADAAAFFLSSEETEVEDNGQQILAFFAVAEDDLLQADVEVDEADDALDAWIAGIFSVLDNSTPIHYAYNSVVTSTGGAGHSIRQDIYNVVIF